MDDKVFDEATANSWIEAIEKPGLTKRDKDIYPRLNKWLEIYGAENILDHGCGQGLCSQKVRGYKAYTGVEASPFMVARAKQTYAADNITFTEGNAYSLPFKDGSFDGAFSVLVFHLLEDLETATAELARVLTKGGSFCIMTANPDAIAAWSKMYTNCEITNHSTGKRLHGVMNLDGNPSEDTLYFHTLNAIDAAFRGQGLHLHGVETFRPASEEDRTDMLLMFAGVKL